MLFVLYFLWEYRLTTKFIIMGYLIIVKVIIDSQVCGYENIHVIIITAITIILVLLLILLYILVLSSIVFANNKHYNIQIHIYYFIIEYYSILL